MAQQGGPSCRMREFSWRRGSFHRIDCRLLNSIYRRSLTDRFCTSHTRACVCGGLGGLTTPSAHKKDPLQLSLHASVPSDSVCYADWPLMNPSCLLVTEGCFLCVLCFVCPCVCLWKNRRDDVRWLRGGAPLRVPMMDLRSALCSFDVTADLLLCFHLSGSAGKAILFQDIKTTFSLSSK